MCCCNVLLCWGALHSPEKGFLVHCPAIPHNGMLQALSNLCELPSMYTRCFDFVALMLFTWHVLVQASPLVFGGHRSDARTGGIMRLFRLPLSAC